MTAAQSFIEASLGKPTLLLELHASSGLEVREFKITEAMNALFTVELVAVSRDADLDFAEIVGAPARFAIDRALAGVVASGRGRSFTGLVNHMEHLGVDVDGLSTYALRIVPSLWLLSQNRSYRIFQQTSEPRIVLDVLHEWGIEVDLGLTLADFKERRYRVQYAESDFAFISRMLEDAGVAFYFDELEGRSRLVLRDRPDRNEPRSPITYVSQPSASVPHDFVTAVKVGQQVLPGKYTLQDFDFRRPPESPASATAIEGQALEKRIERYAFEHGSLLFRARAGESTVGEDREAEQIDLEEGGRVASRRLEATRGTARSVSFSTSALDVRPGTVVSFASHPRAELGNLVVTRSRLAGTSSGGWSHTCEALFADRPFRPARTTEKPTTRGVESATVVGRAGEEIHTDEFGRIRVHFHWDRHGTCDERASSWVHVSQLGGGASFGGLNLPRVGQEVLVDFLGGDPDKPIVIGRVFTKNQRTPYDLPRLKAMTGLRSESTPRRPDGTARSGVIGGVPVGGGNGGGAAGPRSSPLGDGLPMTLLELHEIVARPGVWSAISASGTAHGWEGSELSLNDDQGRELFYMQAQKDMHTLVKDNARSVVGNSRTAKIGSDDLLDVTNKQSIRVGSNRTVDVGGSQRHRAQRDIVQESVEGNQVFMSRESFASTAKEHHLTSDEITMLRVKDSLIVIHPDYIVLQSKEVFINPGMEAAELSATGIRPQTKEEREALETSMPIEQELLRRLR